MELQLVRSRLETKYYRTVKAFVFDIQLIQSNSVIVNKDKTFRKTVNEFGSVLLEGLPL